jgi:hypothetical protein
MGSGALGQLGGSSGGVSGSSPPPQGSPAISLPGVASSIEKLGQAEKVAEKVRRGRISEYAVELWWSLEGKVIQ